MQFIWKSLSSVLSQICSQISFICTKEAVSAKLDKTSVDNKQYFPFKSHRVVLRKKNAETQEGYIR